MVYTAHQLLYTVQDPKEADSIMRVQQDLDDTKIVLVSSLPFNKN